MAKRVGYGVFVVVFLVALLVGGIWLWGNVGGTLTGRYAAVTVVMNGADDQSFLDATVSCEGGFVRVEGEWLTRTRDQQTPCLGATNGGLVVPARRVDEVRIHEAESPIHKLYVQLRTQGKARQAGD